jgi:hypothetical protein
MAYIQPNKLLPPTARVIRPFACSFLAVEGPNIIGKLNLSGVEIPYDSQFTTRITLNPNATKQPLLYGFLGTEVTYIALKIIYDETDPLCNIEEEMFIEYYFQDQPSIIRHIGKLLVLTGNSVHRIPQLFLNNPSPVKVIVEALVANLEQEDIDVNNINNVTIGNLYYNNILSDTILTHSLLVSGSTQLQITGIDGYVQLYLDYVDILTVEPMYITNEIKITTVSDTNIILGFLSLFEMYQGLSRISWVLEDQSMRYLTKEYPTVDIVPPVFHLNPLVLPVDIDTYAYPYTSGTTILPHEIINYFITGVTDERDGIIPVDNVYITIRQYGFVEPITGITQVGVYNIIMGVNDIANNQTVLVYTIIVDDQPPLITFKPIASGSGFTMTEVDMTLPSEGITSNDIITKSIDFIYDLVDGVIINTDAVILVNDIISGLTPMTVLTTPGSYDLMYYVEDKAGNAFTSGKTLVYEGYKILVENEIFTIPNGMSSMDFRFTGDSGSTATIIISGETFIVKNVSGITNDELVWDFGGTGEYNFGSGLTGSIEINVNDTLFIINFMGRGSLLFNIVNAGPMPDYFEVNPSVLFYTSQSGLTEIFNIVSNLSWSITDDIDWILLSDYYGTGTTTITSITMSENITGELRSGITSITASGTTIDITILQESVTPIYSGETYIFNNDMKFIYFGETGTTAIVVLSGISFTIEKSSGNTFVWDLGGADEHEFIVEEYIIVIVEGTVFRITNNSIDDILFTISHEII